LAREIDEKAKRKALARIRRAKAAVERAIAKSEDSEAAEAARVELSEWEEDFLSSVEERLNEFGSAYANPELGRDGEALSNLQIQKLKEIEKKAKGKSPSGFKRVGRSFKSKGAGFKSRTPSRRRDRDINADMPDEAPALPAPDPVKLLEDKGDIQKGFRTIDGGKDDTTPEEPGAGRFRVIDGGKDD
jgi:hypothetical protein